MIKCENLDSDNDLVITPTPVWSTVEVPTFPSSILGGTEACTSASLQTTGSISRQGKRSCNVGEEVERESDAKDDDQINEQIVKAKKPRHERE